MHTFSTRRSVLFASIIALSVLLLAEGVLRVVGVGAPVQPRLILRLMDTDIKLPFMRADPDMFWSPPARLRVASSWARRCASTPWGCAAARSPQPRPTQRRPGLLRRLDHVRLRRRRRRDLSARARPVALAGPRRGGRERGRHGLHEPPGARLLRRVGPQVRPDVADLLHRLERRQPPSRRRPRLRAPPRHGPAGFRWYARQTCTCSAG